MTNGAEADPIRRIASTRMPTRWGMFQALAFERDTPSETKPVETALAMIMGDVTRGAPLLRIHSQCVTSEVFGSLRCDCSDQLEIAMRAIAEEGCGVLIYEHQEGRGIGLMAKLKAYALQDEGLDTIAANHALGFQADCRNFRLPVAVVNQLGVRRVRLLSNNPQKFRALIEGGIDVLARVPCETRPSAHAVVYLKTKKERMGHALTLV
ncbi:MAG TPA: GTP cyclohydrolase II [Bryobacteraceae bacterium]|jgi:GTP cyclohydrolase II|nr:GTP cyclohydrolase II [Bryobacteraceae bacterium]